MGKKLNLAFLILSLAGIFAGSRISKYCKNRKDIALKNPQRVLAIETRKNLEELTWEKRAIEDLNKNIFDKTGRNILYSNAQIGDLYERTKAEHWAAKDIYEELVSSEELAANSASIERYEAGRKLGNKTMYTSLVLFVMAGLGFITRKDRMNISINIEYT